MKPTTTAILIAVLLIGGSVMFSGNKSGGNAPNGTVENVSVVDGKQIIEIRAKGGYSPRVTTAKAGMPTVLKVETSGTFDCSSALVIPSIQYRANLQPSGETLIEIPSQKAGAVLQGRCAMGMYNFSVKFEP